MRNLLSVIGLLLMFVTSKANDEVSTHNLLNLSCRQKDFSLKMMYGWVTKMEGKKIDVAQEIINQNELLFETSLQIINKNASNDVLKKQVSSLEELWHDFKMLMNKNSINSLHKVNNALEAVHKQIDAVNESLIDNNDNQDNYANILFCNNLRSLSQKFLLQYHLYNTSNIVKEQQVTNLLKEIASDFESISSTSNKSEKTLHAFLEVQKIWTPIYLALSANNFQEIRSKNASIEFVDKHMNELYYSFDNLVYLFKPVKL